MSLEHAPRAAALAMLDRLRARMVTLQAELQTQCGPLAGNKMADALLFIEEMRSKLDAATAWQASE